MTNPLCQYKNMLGKPNEGIHSYRIFNIAIADVIMTIIAAYLISLATKFSFPITLILLFVLGIILHRIFCVKTTVDKAIFGNQ